MKTLTNCPRAPHPLRSCLPTVVFLLGGAVFLAGCASQKPRSLGTLPAVESNTLNYATGHLAEESAKLRAVQDEMQKAIEKRAPAPEPQALAPKHDPLEDILVSVNLRKASLSTVLQVLAEQSKMNLLVEPDVLALDKTASLYLKRVSVREFYRNVLEAFDLSAQVEGNTIKIGLYGQRLFNLDFLNTRMDMNIASGGNVFGAMTSGGSSSSGSAGGGDLIRGNVNVSGGSSKQVEPYSEIEANLKRILGTKEGKLDTPAGQPLPGAAQAAVRGGEEDRRELGAVYSLNRSSGTLFVSARPSQIKVVEKLIDQFSSVMRRQVLIEAQLLDVELNDAFQLGVDWNLLRNHLAGVVGDAPIQVTTSSASLPGQTSLPISALSFPSSTIGLASGRSAGLMYSAGAVSVAVSTLRNFGNVKVISNPNIRVRNNTPALLSVGTSSRFVSKSSVTTSNSGGGATTVASDVQTDSVFAGVVVGVVPFIGEHGQIDLMIHPMQTEVDSSSLALQDVGGGNKVTLPTINYKGMTTTLNIKNGDTVIIGGLIDQSTAKSDKGIPGLSDMPVMHWLFGSESDSHKSRELVMVLRVREL